MGRLTERIGLHCETPPALQDGEDLWDNDVFGRICAEDVLQPIAREVEGRHGEPYSLTRLDTCSLAD